MASRGQWRPVVLQGEIPSIRTQPVVQAFRDLEVGLIEDLALVIEAERDGRSPDWSLARVLGDLPSRHSSYFNARFVRKLAAAGGR